jgi:diguanylate cyclase (GGDEF)-like protein
MNLRQRILALVLAASLLPMLAMVWLLFEQRAAAIVQAREQLAVRADGIAGDLNDKISGTSQLLFGLGQVPVLGSADKAACSDFLADVLKENPQYTSLLTILPDGQMHCDALHTGRVLDLGDRGYFKRAVASGHVVVEPAIGRLTGKGVLQIAYPVRNGVGALRFVLLASFNLDDYGSLAAPGLPYPNTRLQIWDGSGTAIMQQPREAEPGLGKSVVTAAEKQFVLVGSAQKTLALNNGQHMRIWATATLPRVPDAGLHVVLNVPEADLYASVDRQFQRTMIWLIAVSVLLLVGAVALAEFAVRRQASRIVSAIARLDAGKFDLPLGAPYPRGEFGQVMAALDRMGASLRTQRIEIARTHEALERQANFDPLTGLANRNLLGDRLEQALIHARRAQRVAAVLVLDLDRFKTVNDSLGHGQGDLLLREVAIRLTDCVRQGDTVARLGGDEFVVLLSDLAEAAHILPVAQKILAALGLPVHLGGHTMSASASLGIAIYPRDGDTGDILLRHADTAMYRAKEQGGNALAYFTPAMNAAVTARLRIEAGLRRALERGELRLFYQPIVDMASGRIASAEALLRWDDPERGLVAPADFIPVAEETGLIVPIGNWVLREACRQARQWMDLGHGVLPVAVNLSARQFADPALEHSVQAALHAARCPASALQLEITESMVIGDGEQALVTMDRLNRLGVRLSIDDFGTGYSSLSYLKRFPVHKLKIDRSFIRDIQIDPNDEAIVDTILVLAKKLGLRCVAEGVETEAQLEFLRALGCAEYQGYLFARPCPAGEFAQLLLRRNTHRREFATP